MFQEDYDMDQTPRAAALERLDVFLGTWDLEAIFPSTPTQVVRGGQTVFEWMKGRQLLIERTQLASPEFPDSLAIVAFNPETKTYTQHYFDSRGVIRLYAMTFSDGSWTLLRTSPDFSPLEFAQRYTGTFSADGNAISGAWETSADGSTWAKDFDLRYVRVA
jgi:hypothetical protein